MQGSTEAVAVDESVAACDGDTDAEVVSDHDCEAVAVVELVRLWLGVGDEDEVPRCDGLGLVDDEAVRDSRGDMDELGVDDAGGGETAAARATLTPVRAVSCEASTDCVAASAASARRTTASTEAPPKSIHPCRSEGWGSARDKRGGVFLPRCEGGEPNTVVSRMPARNAAAFPGAINSEV